MQLASGVYAALKPHKPLLKQYITFLQSLHVSISYDSLSGLQEFRLHFAQNETIYLQFRKLMTVRQWKLLIAIAKEERLKKTTVSNFLQKFILGSASSVKIALQSLLEKRLIISIVLPNEEFYLVDNLFLLRYLQYKN
ncbi:MAG: hypothetical protein LBI45_08800 [Bacteroidales bacterium]|jgi:hypothetical protein|nr:hypothetical protein [Bacteroidales bacterium]